MKVINHIFTESSDFRGAFTLDTSDPHHIDPHQLDPHQRFNTRQKDNPHQIDPHQLDPHQLCIHTRRTKLMRNKLMHNRLFFLLIEKMLDIHDHTYVFAFAAEIGIASTFITIFVQGVCGFNQFCTTGPIYSDLTLRLCKNW